jgi:lipid-A-disaccharide synthase-like uncharacterized protein
MNHILWTSWGVIITPWKIIGYAGMVLFTLRWVVQVVASRRAGHPTVPRMFWYMSIVGSGMLLAYFLFGHNDGPGIVSNLFPGLLAVYNLFLDFAHQKKGAPNVQPASFSTEVADNPPAV